MVECFYVEQPAAYAGFDANSRACVAIHPNVNYAGKVLVRFLFGLVQAQAFFTSTLPPGELQNKQAVLETTQGPIVLDLLADAAPNHVAHFITRVREGAYDGTTFHRVIAMGIIQGGDPLSKDPAQEAKYGTGRPWRAPVRGQHGEAHARRGVGRPACPDSATAAARSSSSALPIRPRLDGQYTVFARVVEGSAMAQKISLVPRRENVPADRIEIKRATIREKPAPEPEPFAETTRGGTGEAAGGHRDVDGQHDGRVLRRSGADARARLPAHGGVWRLRRHRDPPRREGLRDSGRISPAPAGAARTEAAGLRAAMQPEFNPTPHERGIVSMAQGRRSG